MLTKLDQKNSTIDVCQLKNESEWFKIDYTEQEIAFKIIDLEIILPTRVLEEHFIDLLNLMRTSYGIEGSNWNTAMERNRTANIEEIGFAFQAIAFDSI